MLFTLFRGKVKEDEGRWGNEREEISGSLWSGPADRCGNGRLFHGKVCGSGCDYLERGGLLIRTLLVQGSSVNREEERGQFLLSIDEDTEIRIHGLEWEVKDMFPGMRFAISYEGEIPEGDLPTLSHVLAIDLQGNYHEDGSWSYEEELP